MNLYRSIHVARLVCFLGALVALVRTNAQDWETIFTYEMPGYQVVANSIVLDPSDEWAAQRLFVGTVAIPVQEEVDQHPPGKLFIIDSSTGMHQEASLARTRTTKVLGFSRKSGALFAYLSGSSDGQSPNEIYRSSDRGASWTTVDTLPTDFLQAFTGDDEGSLFTAGNRWTLRNGSWRFLGAFVRKSIDDGLTWNTVDAPNGTEYRALHFVPGPNGGLFAGGKRPTNGWIVRRSHDSGLTWTTVMTTGVDDYVQAITSDAQGRIFVIGGVFDAPLRMSTNGGDTWQSLGLPARISASDMVTDSAGNFYVAGSLMESSGGTYSVFRRTPAGSWEDLGPKTYPSEGRIFHLALDAAGNLYTSGSYGTHPAVGVIVRRLAMPPVALPPLEVVSSGGALTVSWLTVEGAQLESTSRLGDQAAWERVPIASVVEGSQSSVRIAIQIGPKYFRLLKP